MTMGECHGRVFSCSCSLCFFLFFFIETERSALAGFTCGPSPKRRLSDSLTLPEVLLVTHRLSPKKPKL